ncbi:MAG: methyltransferase domain-containing protein [Chitinophagales bacterium]
MVEHLTKEFWEELYESGEIRWDIGIVSPPLKAYFDQLTNKDISIFIPGCGNSYEAECLAKNGFKDVTVIDLAIEPVERLRSALQDFPSVKIIQGNFFDHQGKYDLIIEQTFFCAIDPSLRKQYVEKMHELLNDGGMIAGVMFKTEFEKEGPPFGGTPEEYKQLFSNRFTIKTLADCYNSHPKRDGNEVFVEFVKK